MGISAKEAADLVGMSKTAIFKAIRTGKISAEKDSNGVWQIEPVELFRVYQPVSDSSRKPLTLSSQQFPETSQRENELLREMLLDKDNVIADLRARLDAEAEERRRLSTRLEVETEERLKLTLRLTEARSSAPPSQAPSPLPPAPAEVEKPKGFWQRLLGR